MALPRRTRNFLNIPNDLRYSKTHEWIRREGNIATIGITDYAQSELGDIVYVDLPSPGRILQPGSNFGTVESVKTISDIYSPVGGEVTEVNGELEANSELLNQDPYGKGWLIKVRAEGEIEDLLDADSYKAKLDH